MENQALVTLVVVLIIVDRPTCMKRNVYYFHKDKGHGPKYYLSELVKFTQI
jgi:hypothetical protein